MALTDRIAVINDAVIQQADTPRNLCFNPVNVFIAGFMDFPQIKFWNGKLTEFEGSFFLNWNNNKIKLHILIKNQIGYIKNVYADIRVENIYTDKANISKYKDSVIDAEVKQ